MKSFWTALLFVTVALAPPGADFAQHPGGSGSKRSTLPFKRARKSDLVIQTTCGMVKGVKENAVNGQEVNVWWGIPYAEPPVEDLRFKRPVPIKPWQGVKKANKRPNACVQIKDVLFPGFPGAEMWNPNTKMSEDCLYLNIAVPSHLQSNGSTPVMVNTSLTNGRNTPKGVLREL